MKRCMSRSCWTSNAVTSRSSKLFARRTVRSSSTGSPATGWRGVARTSSVNGLTFADSRFGLAVASYTVSGNSNVYGTVVLSSPTGWISGGRIVRHSR